MKKANLFYKKPKSVEKLIKEQLETGDGDIFDQFEEKIADIGDIDVQEIEGLSKKDPEDDFVESFLEQEKPLIVKSNPKQKKPEKKIITYEEGPSQECVMNVEQGPSSMLLEVEEELEDIGPEKQSIAVQEMESKIVEVPSKVEQLPLEKQESEEQQERKIMFKLPIVYPK
jgi:hypothetical protein